MAPVTRRKQQHSRCTKQERKTAARSKRKDSNNQLDPGVPVENNTIVNAFTDDGPTFCASEEKLPMQPTSEGLSNTTTKNSSDISSALSIDHLDDQSQSASTSSSFDPESTGIESMTPNSDHQLPVTTKKNRRKVTRRKRSTNSSPVLVRTGSVWNSDICCTPPGNILPISIRVLHQAPLSASTTPSPASSPGLAQQASNQITSVAGVPGNIGQFICPSCNKVVDSQSEYTRHIRQHNFVEASATSHTCSLCRKALSSASSLDRHMLVHSGERPFSCHICGMAFTTNGNMHRHRRTHHGGASLAAGTSSPVQVSDDENIPARRARTYVRRNRIPPPPRPVGRRSATPPRIVPSNVTPPEESEIGDENSLSGAAHDDDWEDYYDRSTSEHSTSVSSVPLAPPQKRQCTENNNVLLEKSDDAANNSRATGTLSNDFDDSLHCLVCGKTFLSKMGLKKHLDAHLPNELQCKECKDSKAFPSYQALLKHCRLTHYQSVPELKSDNDAIPSNSATKGFHDLTFVDFSSRKFALIAKSACERNVRSPSSTYHIFQCQHCKKAFPSSGSLKMHVKATHPAFRNAMPSAVSLLKRSTPKIRRDEKTTILTVTPSTCNQCHAAFPSHHQLAMHCLRHQEAEQCTTPYSTMCQNGSENMDPATADLAPQLNKENFLALFELQSKTKDPDVVPTLTSFNPKQQFFQSRNNEMEDGAHVTNLSTQRKNPPVDSENHANTPFGSGNSNTGDFADIQSMITVTSTASAIPSMMILGSSPFTSHVESPPPPESLASPRLADSVTASPELPLELNNASALASANQPSPSTSSLSSTPSSLSASSAKSSENEQEPYSLDPKDDARDKVAKDFACNQCPQVLPNLRALKAHNRIHLGGSPYRCNVCSFVSTEKNTLMRHLRTHNGERPYMCTICQYAFTTKANCERHLRTKHNLHNKEEVRGAIRYMGFDIREGAVDGSASFASSNSCPHCNLQFAQAKLLKQHLHLQHNDMYSPKPFTCLKCKVRFSTKKNCMRHISRSHPDVAMPEEAVGTTLTSLASFSQAGFPAEACLNPQIEPEPEPARSHSANGDLAHTQIQIAPAVASTSDSGLAQPDAILDLSSTPQGLCRRPASYPGAFIPAAQYETKHVEMLDRPLDPNDAEYSDQSSLESLINLTTSHMNGYAIPPQDQPLDLALYPMDLSYNASSLDETHSPNSALGPMDLSASHRQTPSFSALNVRASITPNLTVLTSAPSSQSFCHSSPSPFQSRAPASFMPAQITTPPSQASPFPVAPIALQHIASRYNQRPVQNLGTVYSPNGVQGTPHISTPPAPISQNVSPNLSSQVFTIMPCLSPQGPLLMPPEPYSSPKTPERGGQKRSSSSNGHGRHLPSTSPNSLLLKKQKQRRYRTERPFRCAHCASGFTLRSNMERHVKQQHPELWSSKARGRKLVPTNTLTMVTPSISISPIHSSSVPHMAEMPQLMSSTPAFPELLHMMQADVEQPHITFHRNEKKITQVPSVSLLKTDHAKSTISSEVKQAISKQIKLRKNHLDLTMPAFPTGISSAIKASFSDNDPALVDDGSSSSDSSLTIALPPVVKVAETVFPPSDERPDSAATNSPRTSPLPVAEPVDDAEDTLADLASVSKLLDTANQQNIQEMFRCRETVDDDDNVDHVEGKDKDGLVDPFKVTHTQTKDDRYLFHDDNANKFIPMPAEVNANKFIPVSTEAVLPTSCETPTKTPDKSKDTRRSAYTSAPNRVACLYCSRLFPWISSLRRHVLTHTGQKPHKCPVCPLWFTTKSNCDRHLARKHNSPVQAKGGKPAMLVICPPPGTSTSSHDCTARNAPDRPHRCLLCLSSTFATPKNLQKHQHTKHPRSQPLPQSTGASEHEKAEASTSDAIKMEAQSDGNSNSGSEQCWGESEESGEDTGAEGSSPGRLCGCRPGSPMFVCFLCNKSFVEREACLQHMLNEHPTQHARLILNMLTDNALENDDSTRKQSIPETPSNEPSLAIASDIPENTSIPEMTPHSSDVGTDTESDEAKKSPDKDSDNPEIKRENTKSDSPKPSQI